VGQARQRCWQFDWVTTWISRVSSTTSIMSC
jgi:hypothetical protein